MKKLLLAFALLTASAFGQTFNISLGGLHFSSGPTTPTSCAPDSSWFFVADGSTGWQECMGGVYVSVGSGAGVVTGTGLTAHALVLGNGGSAVKIGTLGTTTTVLHGNAAGDPTYGSVVDADHSGQIGTVHGGTGVDLSGSGGSTMILAEDSSHVISARALVAADIPNLAASKITSGTLGLAQGGLNLDLTSTGGTSQVLKQTSLGGSITVAQLACSDLSNSATSCSAVPTLDAIGNLGASKTNTFGGGFTLTLSGAVTAASTSALTITNANSTNNNSSSGLTVSTTGTSTGAIGLIVNNSTSSTGDIADFQSGGTNKLNLTAAGALTLANGSTLGLTLGSGATATPAITMGSAGFYSPSTNIIVFQSATSADRISLGAGGLNFTSNTTLGWTNSTSAPNGAANLGLSRDNTNAVLDVGNGTQGNTTGRVKASGYMSVGTKFSTDTGCGTPTSLTGGATAGSMVGHTTGTCTVVVTMGDSATAPNGWSCTSNDLTTPADSWHESASTTTTATFTGTTVTGDTLNFACVGF